MAARKITLPLTEELAKTLHAGDSVLLTGTIYTSRDAGHKRMCEALARGEKLPFDPADATIYYVGPTPAKPGTGHRKCRTDHQRTYGCVCTNHDVCRCPWYDRKRSKTSGSSGCYEKIQWCVFRSDRRSRSTACKMYQEM